MNYLTFQNTFQKDILLSVKEIRKIPGAYNNVQLIQWQKKGYITSIARGYYIFNGIKKDEYLLMYIANKLKSSYISLESALSYYGLIPEGVYVTTSVTTKLPKKWKTSLGDLWYQMIRPDYYFGYEYIDYLDKKILIADPEKAILDYCYLHSEVTTEDDFDELRINVTVFKSTISEEKLQKYLDIMKSKSLSKKIKNLLTYIHSHD